jgi:hypothetical protein
LKTEQDNLVWRLSMLGVYRDGSDEAGRLALLAVNHHWPDVRILGCEYVGRHGLTEQAAWLLPLFYDANKAVQLSAVTAAGKCRNPIVLDGLPASGDQAGLRGLRPLLTESQGQLQFAVVASMSRLGDPQAMQELARQALDGLSTARAAHPPGVDRAEPPYPAGGTDKPREACPTHRTTPGAGASQKRRGSS